MGLSTKHFSIRFLLFSCLAIVPIGSVAAQKTISCSDGDRIAIDIKAVEIQYDASSFAATLSSLSAMSARLDIAPKKLQEAAAATQQWDEFLKGLVAGYNACAITKQQYVDGLNRIYPRLEADAAGLEEIRKLVASGQRADDKLLRSRLDSFYSTLREFARVSGQEILLDRIEAISDQLSTISSGQHEISLKQDLIIEKLIEIQRANAVSPSPTPTEVNIEIREVKQSLLARADEAETAYRKGYELATRYRFREAIPYFRQAIDAVPLPIFYLAIAQTYDAIPDLQQAEAASREGISLATGSSERKYEAVLSGQLSKELLRTGKLDAALTYAQRELQIDEKLFGIDDPNVAIDSNNIGTVLFEKGDLNGALEYFQRALRINQKASPSDDSEAATDLSNISGILRQKGDLDGALRYARQGLAIAEKNRGPYDPTVVARYYQNIASILRDRGDFHGALDYSQRAFEIDKRILGPNHPNLAGDARSIGNTLIHVGNLDGALEYTQLALKIHEAAYGPNSIDVAADANNLGAILFRRGDIEGALSYVQRALTIVEETYGPDHPYVADSANNIASYLTFQGKVDLALPYAQRAMAIAEKNSDYRSMALFANSLSNILFEKGDLRLALDYSTKALRIDTGIYGSDGAQPKADTANIERILEAMQKLNL